MQPGLQSPLQTESFDEFLSGFVAKFVTWSFQYIYFVTCQWQFYRKYFLGSLQGPSWRTFIDELLVIYEYVIWNYLVFSSSLVFRYYLGIWSNLSVPCQKSRFLTIMQKYGFELKMRNNLFKQWKVRQFLVTEFFFNLFLEVSHT